MSSLHVTCTTLRFGKYGPHGTHRVRDGVGLPLALVPPDALSHQLRYKGLWRETKEQIEEYFDFLRSDPGYLIWPINDKAGHKGQRLEDIYDKDPGYLEWVVNTYKGEVLIPLVVDYMKYREALVGAFSDHSQDFVKSYLTGLPTEGPEVKDGGFCPIEQLTPDIYQPSYGRRSLPKETPFRFWKPGLQMYFSWELLEGEQHPWEVELRETEAPPPARTIPVGRGKKPSAWWVSNPDKTGQESIDSSKGEFFYIDPFGKSYKELLWIPPRSFTQYRSDLFFVANYKVTEEVVVRKRKVKKTKYLSRTHENKEDRLGLYIKLMEDIDLMGDGCEDVGMLISRLKVCMRSIFSLWEYEMKNTTFPPTPGLYSYCVVRSNFGDLKRFVEDKFTEVCDRLLGLNNTVTYYEDRDEHNDFPEEQEEMELSPQDEQAVRDGEENIEEQETEDPPQEYVEEGHEIYYESEEEMDFLGEYIEGNYIMHGERRWL